MIDFVHLICDFAPGDLAWAEVTSAITSQLPPHVGYHMTSVKSFDTIATGFVLAQLGMAPAEVRPANLTVFANCAPRKDRSAPKINNEGEGLLYAKLKNGVFVAAVNSGYSLSFIADEIAELWSTNASAEGSQFRSRDFFPRIVHNIFAGDFSFRKNKLEVLGLIPTPPLQVVAYIDSFGNLKTTIRTTDAAVSLMKSGTRVKIKIGNIVRAATIATGMFNVMEGDMAFAPGSSGYENRYWELFVRGSSAFDEFGQPPTGSEITIETID